MNFIALQNLVPNEYDNFNSASNVKRYIYAVYWATVTMTTVGYGDIVAYSIGEKLTAMVFIIIGEL